MSELRKTIRREGAAKNRSIRLTDNQLEELNRIALSMRANPTSGREASWSSMVQLIAEGRLQVVDPHRRIPFLSFKKAPKWWTPEPDGSMPLEFVLKKTRMNEQEAEDRGFEIKGGRIRAPWKAWKAKIPGKPALKLDAGCPPEWWMPPKGEDNAMKLTAAMKASGYKKDELTGAGLNLVGQMLYGLSSWEE